MTSVSVVCPTYQRESFVRKLVQYFIAQTYEGDLQLLILDDSPERSDALDTPELREQGINYYHVPNTKLSIGAKMNIMLGLAEGDIIVKFDDDDYYAPQYIERMVGVLGEHDFASLSRWFAYSHRDNLFCYWEADILSPHHFVVSAWDPLQWVSTNDWGPDYTRNAIGYGFSFVFRKSVFPKVQFADMNWGEDYDFYQKFLQAGFKAVHAADNEGLALHLVHSGNASRMFPQYILPRSMVRTFFPTYAREEGL